MRAAQRSETGLRIVSHVKSPIWPEESDRRVLFPRPIPLEKDPLFKFYRTLDKQARVLAIALVRLEKDSLERLHGAGAAMNANLSRMTITPVPQSTCHLSSKLAKPELPDALNYPKI